MLTGAAFIRTTIIQQKHLIVMYSCDGNALHKFNLNDLQAFECLSFRAVF